MKPLVGVMPLWDEEKDSLWMLPGYLEGLKEAGATPVILVEALYKPSYRFLWAVQWHPEFSYKNDENSKKIFKAFVESLTEKS